METLSPEIAAFVERTLGSVPAEVVLLDGGANNQVFKIYVHGRPYVLKKYFICDQDPRDRFLAEKSFYSALWPLGIHVIPQPLGWDSSLRLGLFPFIEGRKLAPDEISQWAVDQALEFIVTANRAIQGRPELFFPIASEACFSFADHVACLERRLQRFDGLVVRSEVDAEARELIERELQPRWRQVRADLERHAVEHGIDFHAPLAAGLRCVSPSDFGFHNALARPDGRLFFHDFEYAGWDDPAKLVCDFFCQPQVPVPMEYWDKFVRRLTADLPHLAPQLESRASVLQPVYQIKWCCIMLNEFLSGELARRKFSLGTMDIEERKRTQLQKARSAVLRI